VSDAPDSYRSDDLLHNVKTPPSSKLLRRTRFLEGNGFLQAYRVWPKIGGEATRDRSGVENLLILDLQHDQNPVSETPDYADPKICYGKEVRAIKAVFPFF
jgi:hypothetical protein